MTTDHMELRGVQNIREELAHAKDNGHLEIEVRCIDLSELLDSYDALVAAGQPKRKAAAKKAAAPGDKLPDWLPLEPWEAFLSMRVKIKKPATEYAQKLLIKKLDAFRLQGLNVTEVLEQSITSGWQDLYAPKNSQRGFGYDPAPSRPARLTRDQQQELSTQEALRRLDGIPAFDPNTVDMEAPHGSR